MGLFAVKGPPAQVAKALRAAKKRALETAAGYWHTAMFPGHFSLRAAALYHYQPRKAQTMREKAARFHHQRPLEKTGRLKRQTLRAVRLAGSAARVRVTLMGPPYLRMRRRDQGAPDMAAELTAVTRDEETGLGRILARHMTHKLRAAANSTVGQTTRRI